jgi:hypothetical protein
VPLTLLRRLLIFILFSMHNPFNLVNSLNPGSKLRLANSSSQVFNLNQINRTNLNRLHSQLHSLSQSRKAQLNTNLRMFPRKPLGRPVKRLMQVLHLNMRRLSRTTTLKLL